MSKRKSDEQNLEVRSNKITSDYFILLHHSLKEAKQMAKQKQEDAIDTSQYMFQAGRENAFENVIELLELHFPKLKNFFTANSENTPKS